jgi:hypothetical protein
MPDFDAERAILDAFTPHGPIRRPELFRGRRAFIREALDTVNTPGLHAVVYGERGVGKTSLANTLRELIGDRASIAMVNCGRVDTFETVLNRLLGSIQLMLPRSAVGFIPGDDPQLLRLRELVDGGDAATRIPDAIAMQLAQLRLDLVFIVDEFDQLAPQAADHFADLIKSLSDRGAPVCLVLVGVAEDITALVRSHASVERNIRQILLPRMSDIELEEIIDNGLQLCGFSLQDAKPRKRVIQVSQGFAQYTHLLMQYGCRAALDAGRRVVTDADIIFGMVQAIERADQSHRELYYQATTGSHRDSAWPEVVAACALADVDERGYFAVHAVLDELVKMLGRPMTPQSINYHLGKLVSPDRGPLLQKLGPPRRTRYRFVNPLMRPYIIMRALSDGRISA